VAPPYQTCATRGGNFREDLVRSCRAEASWESDAPRASCRARFKAHSRIRGPRLTAAERSRHLYVVLTPSSPSVRPPEPRWRTPQERVTSRSSLAAVVHERALVPAPPHVEPHASVGLAEEAPPEPPSSMFIDETPPPADEEALPEPSPRCAPKATARSNPRAPTRPGPHEPCDAFRAIRCAGVSIRTEERDERRIAKVTAAGAVAENATGPEASIHEGRHWTLERRQDPLTSTGRTWRPCAARWASTRGPTSSSRRRSLRRAQAGGSQGRHSEPDARRESPQREGKAGISESRVEQRWFGNRR
jgi:hypothetical protein